ncbi:MAG: hypothetical protein PVH87_14280 [Desulfobacteraceae bacterium]
MAFVNNKVTPYYSHEPDLSRSIRASRTQLAAVSGSRSLDLDLVTEEGDKVTLSIDTQASAIYAVHGEVGMDDEQLYAQWGEFRGRQYEHDVSFTVEGDLNKQERREIRKVIRTINRMMHNFVQGKLNPMMAKTQGLQGLETIGSLAVELSYERQLLVAQQTQAAVTYDQSGELAGAAAITDLASQRPVIGRTPIERPVLDAAETVARDMAKAVAFAPAPADPLRTLADRLFQAYRDQAAERNPVGGRILDHLRAVFEKTVDVFGQSQAAGDEFADGVQ